MSTLIDKMVTLADEMLAERDVWEDKPGLYNTLQNWHTRLKTVIDAVQNLGFTLDHLRTTVSDKDKAIEELSKSLEDAECRAVSVEELLEDKCKEHRERKRKIEEMELELNHLTVVLEEREVALKVAKDKFSEKVENQRTTKSDSNTKESSRLIICPDCGVTSYHQPNKIFCCGWDNSKKDMSFAITPSPEALKRAKAAIGEKVPFLTGETDVEKVAQAALASLAWFFDWATNTQEELTQTLSYVKRVDSTVGEHDNRIEKLEKEIKEISRWTVVEAEVRSTGDTLATKEIEELKKEIKAQHKINRSLLDEIDMVKENLENPKKSPVVDTGNCTTCTHFIPNIVGGCCKLGNDTKRSQCRFHTLAPLNKKAAAQPKMVYQIVDEDNLPVLGCVFPSEEAAKAREWEPHWAGITPLEIEES